MDPQTANFLSNLDADAKAFLTAFTRLQDRFREGLDRDVQNAVNGVDFAQEGDLSHLSEAKLIQAFVQFNNVEATMQANGRAAQKALLELVRSWTL